MPDIGCRALVLTFGPPRGEEPWWYAHIDRRPLRCAIEHARVSLGNKYAMQVSAWQLPFVLLKVAHVLWRARVRFDYVFTFECDLTSFAVALLQTLTFSRRPRHVILQFIMREKTASLASRVKYRFMRFCFKSVHRVICSSRSEADYYRSVFSWAATKTAFVPYHTHPSLLRKAPTPESDYIIAAGRSFRDYPTFLAAVADLPIRVIVVAGRGALSGRVLPGNVELRSDIPPDELNYLLENSRVVVLPLEDRKISIGQSVLLQAMSFGKPVVCTRTAGTEDYIRDKFDGLLVPPRDPTALRVAIETLLQQPELRYRLGTNAIRAMYAHHLPQHYVLNVARSLNAAPATHTLGN